MINIEKIFNKKIDIDKICHAIKINPEVLKEFEKNYSIYSIDDYSFSNYIKNKIIYNYDRIDTLKSKIVDELIAQTNIWTYDGNTTSIITEKKLPLKEMVTINEINEIEIDKRPQLTGNLMKKDINTNSSQIILYYYYKYITLTNENDKKNFYDRFRQGLDLLDLDPILYEMLSLEKNNMSNWLPKIIECNNDFFKIPKTTIIKVPITLLQLTRIGYDQINQTTKDIVNEYCKKVFNLNEKNKYFIKTGTHSQKFDFRNALVYGKNEINSIGEYFLYIHSKDLEMASYDINNNRPSFYGISTTNEWIVRNYIEDNENNLTIYHGLPLHTEYRVFVDFDVKKVLGVHSYWDKDTLVNSFTKKIEFAEQFIKNNKFNNQDIINQAKQDIIDAKHDLITYLGNYNELNNRYLNNKDLVCKNIELIIKNCDLKGQWSIDIMQNKEDFYIIDMQIAQQSYFYKETVSEEYRKEKSENWIPNFEKKIKKM